MNMQNKWSLSCEQKTIKIKLWQQYFVFEMIQMCNFMIFICLNFFEKSNLSQT